MNLLICLKHVPGHSQICLVNYPLRCKRVKFMIYLKSEERKLEKYQSQENFSLWKNYPAFTLKKALAYQRYLALGIQVVAPARLIFLFA